MPTTTRATLPLMLTLTATAAVTALALSGCAGSADAGSPAPGAGAPGVRADPPPPPAAPGTVTAQGTVLQLDGEAAQLCLGAVAESYPPQCSGAEIVGWDWSTVDGEESASGVTWGAYAIDGSWDGTAFTATGTPILLALYDPLPRDPDPRTDPASPGAATDEEQEALPAELSATEDLGVLGAFSDNGYVFVTVPYDDGSIQEFVDAVYGPDTVAVQSALISR